MEEYNFNARLESVDCNRKMKIIYVILRSILGPFHFGAKGRLILGFFELDDDSS